VQRESGWPLSPTATLLPSRVLALAPGLDRMILERQFTARWVRTAVGFFLVWIAYRADATHPTRTCAAPRLRQSLAALGFGYGLNEEEETSDNKKFFV